MKADLHDITDECLVAAADAHCIAGKLLVKEVDAEACAEAARQLERTARKLRKLSESAALAQLMKEKA